VSTDGGALLLRQADRKIGLLKRVASCFTERRSPLLDEHQLGEMLSQRIYGLALDYEDLNDHEQLRHDPLMAVLAGRRKLEDPLAGKPGVPTDRSSSVGWKSTLNPLELPGGSKRYHKIDYVPEKIDLLLSDLFTESHAEAPDQMVIDLDATEIPLHGHQPERFFHGYYDSYCYLPLNIFAGDQLLCARLRPANIDGAAGALDEVKRIVAQLRTRWPKVRIVLRGDSEVPTNRSSSVGWDSGFCREELMAWCEADENRVDFLFGLARNCRLQKIVGKQMHEAMLLHAETGKAARVFTEFDYQTYNSWARARRVVAKAEVLDKGENPRFVVTSLGADEWAARELYEKFYCRRGEMENRITEQMCLFAYRLSTEEMKGNHLRLYLSALDYTLVEALRRLALKGTEWAEAQVDTIRLKLFKIVALVRINARRVWPELSSTYPWKQIYARAFDALRC
jgi:hypothetical protein